MLLAGKKLPTRTPCPMVIVAKYFDMTLKQFQHNSCKVNID